MIAEQTEKDIDETRSQYIPVAIRTRILFFCTYDLVCFNLYLSLMCQRLSICFFIITWILFYYLLFIIIYYLLFIIYCLSIIYCI